MNVSPGDTVYIVARDRWGAENFIDIQVAGIFHYGFPPIDKHVVFLDLQSAMDLLDMYNHVSRIVMRLNPGISAEKGAALLSEKRASRRDPQLEDIRPGNGIRGRGGFRVILLNAGYSLSAYCAGTA